MSEWLESVIANGGPLMVPLLLLAAVSPLLGITLYVMGAAMKNRAWALRFALGSLTLGIGLPLGVWGYAAWKTQQTLQEVQGTVAPEDWATLQAAARSELLALPWAALLSSPWLMLSGFGLLGIALLGPRASVSQPAQPLRPFEG